MLVVVLGLTACGSSNKEELQYDESTLEQASEFIISYCSAADDSTIEQLESMPEFDLQLQLTQMGLPYTPESFLGTIDSWSAATKECGTYIGHDDYAFEVSGDEIHVTAKAEFEERTATVSFIYDENMYLESLTVDADYSLGEIMKKAGLNTLLGMGTVFCGLIFISVLISFFKYIPMIEESLKKNKGAVKAETKEQKVEDAVVDVDVEDDTELIAVIAAAIAAAEGTSTDGFIVRSIRRRPSNKWN